MLRSKNGIISNDFIKNQMIFSDFDAFAEKANQVIMQHRQLDKGKFIGSLTQVNYGSVIISKHRMNRTILQQGIGLLGYTTFLIPGNMDQDFSWRKSRLRGDCIGILKSGMEHSCVTLPNFLGYPVSISNNYLNEISNILGYPNFMKYINKNETIEINKNRAKQIHNMVSMICNFEVNDDSVFTYELPKLIITSMSESDNEDQFTVIKRSDYIFKKTQDYIENIIDINLNILTMCKEIGVSERNMRYIFNHKTGISPKKYIKSIKLNRVRNMLKINSVDENVNSIANKVGFWHSGQFAADYKRLFGELPSDTLKY